MANNSKTVAFSEILAGNNIVQHYEMDLCRNFQNDSSIDVGVTAPETVIFVFFPMCNFEKLILLNHCTDFNESWFICSLGYSTQNECLDF